MSEIKNNREYQASLKEIEERKKEISDREDHALELMENLETLKRQVKELEQDVSRRKSELKQQKHQIEEDSGQIDAKIARVESLQNEVIKQLDPELLKRWQFLLRRQGGIAVAAVEKGVCQTCRLNLPPQKFIELQRDNEIMFCPHCHRFIYWPGHDHYAFVRDDYESLN
jgi:predicted  nucleic acid-binding Zn-ribbon protein